MKPWKMRLVAWGLPAALMLAGTGCADRVAGGGGSEAGNAIVFGRVVDQEGRPVAAARVLALAPDHDPVQAGPAAPCKAGVTNAQGRYQLACRDTLGVTLTIRVPESELGCRLTGLRPARGKGAEAPDAVIGVAGGIRVRLPAGVPSSGSYVYIPGTPQAARIDSAAAMAGVVLLDTVPPGPVPAVLYKAGRDASPLELAADTVLAPGDLLQTGMLPAWKFSRYLILDTKATGADVAETLTGFPWMLRLNSGNFDFSQAQGGGADLRFAKPDGTPLRSEIESWDSASSRAVVWVRIDTVYGSRDDQAIAMLWGNPSAAAVPGAVFDTADGFAGAWHLQESSPGTGAQGIYRNAVPGGQAADDYIAGDSRNNGFIGTGMETVGTEYLEIAEPGDRLKPASGLSLSAWIRPQQADIAGSTIMALGNSYGLGVESPSKVRFFLWDGTKSHEVVADAIPVMDGNWHHIAGTFADGVMRLYVDGTEAGSAPVAGPIEYGASRFFRIGTSAGDVAGKSAYTGGIDEVEVGSAARNAAWVKLAFANQKAATKSWRFGP